MNPFPSMPTSCEFVSMIYAARDAHNLARYTLHTPRTIRRPTSVRLLSYGITASAAPVGRLGVLCSLVFRNEYNGESTSLWFLSPHTGGEANIDYVAAGAPRLEAGRETFVELALCDESGQTLTMNNSSDRFWVTLKYCIDD